MMVFACHAHQVFGDIIAYTNVLTTVMTLVVKKYRVIVLSVILVITGHNVNKSVIVVKMISANYATVV
jgi:hypothetical protein